MSFTMLAKPPMSTPSATMDQQDQSKDVPDDEDIMSAIDRELEDVADQEESTIQSPGKNSHTQDESGKEEPVKPMSGSGSTSKSISPVRDTSPDPKAIQENPSAEENGDSDRAEDSPQTEPLGKTHDPAKNTETELEDEAAAEPMETEESEESRNQNIREQMTSMVDKVASNEDDASPAPVEPTVDEDSQDTTASEGPDYDEGLSRLNDINKSNQNILDEDGTKLPKNEGLQVYFPLMKDNIKNISFL